MELNLRQLNRATLARQFLLKREKTTALKAIERLVAMQAQLPRPPFIGLWSRVAGFKRADLAKLLIRKQVVRGTLLRGTLHLMSTRDFVAFRAAFAQMLVQSIEAVLREKAKGLDVDLVAAQATKFFFEAGPKTFEEVRGHLVGLNPKGNDRAMGYAVRCTLQLVQVPIDAPWSFPTDAQFTLAQTWFGAPTGTDANPQALVLRYLAAFGPASVADMQTWSGLKNLGDAFLVLRPTLKLFRDSRGRELFDLPKAPRPEEGTPVPVRFLPDYDNLVLGHADRSRVIADAHRTLIATKNLQVLPTFLVDGFVAGTWKIERAKASATLTMKPFESLTRKTRDELTVEAAALLKFVEPEAAKQLVLFG